MPTYDKPTKVLMMDWAKDNLKSGQIFAKSEPVAWFKLHYPLIKSNTVEMHVEGMSVNNRIRKHYPHIRLGSGHDLFWKADAGLFRLWNSESDPAPVYKAEIEVQEGGLIGANEEAAEDKIDAAGNATFAYEKDLQNYLVRNLHVLEPGLKLYEEEGFNGVEYNAGGRFIDILAVDREDALVVIELKVSRGYDRVIGQLLRYMGWVEANLESDKGIRGIIVANEITNDLVLATRHLPAVKLFQYGISFTVAEVLQNA